MRVLVTGAGGYIGSALVRRLVTDCHEAVAWKRQPPGAAEWPTDSVLRRERVTHVVHLAAVGGPSKCVADPVGAIRTNVCGTQLVAETAQAAGISPHCCVLASSLYVYPPRQGLCRETDYRAPETLYGATKEAAERAWPGLVLRLANVYGGAGASAQRSAFSLFAARAAQGEAIRVRGAGERIMDYVHLADACSAIIASLVRGPTMVRAINVGGGCPTRVVDLARLAAAAGSVEVVAGDPYSGDDDAAATRHLAIDRARELLGWVPKHDLRREVERAVEEARRA